MVAVGGALSVRASAALFPHAAAVANATAGVRARRLRSNPCMEDISGMVKK
jgi:hypothetical protein